MDYCKFNVGKQKRLLVGSKRRDNDLTKRLTLYKKHSTRWNSSIDNAIHRLYINVIEDVVNFIKDGWNTNQTEIPTGVAKCEHIDCFSIENTIYEHLNVHPILISSPVPSLCFLAKRLRSNNEAKCIVLKQVESIPGQFIDDLVSVITDSEWKIPVVLIITISVDLSVIYERCSYETYSHLNIKQFGFPAPNEILKVFLHTAMFSAENKLKLDYALLDCMKNRFSDISHSINQSKKLANIVMLKHFMNSKVEDLNKTDEKVFMDKYIVFLHLLYKLIVDIPYHSVELYELHRFVQSEVDFFNAKNGIFSKWIGVWLTWEADEMKNALKLLLSEVEKIDSTLFLAVQALQNDLNNLKSRLSEVRKKFSPESSMVNNIETRKAKKNSRITLEEMQQNLKEKMAVSKHVDVLSHDRQNFVKLLAKIFSSVLVPFDQVPELEGNLLHFSDDLIDLWTPNLNDTLEWYLSQMKSSTEERNDTQMDLKLAYSIIQSLWSTEKNILINKWFDLFEKQTKPIDGINIQARFFKCLAELEFLGIVRAVSDNNTTSVHLLRVSSFIA